MFKSVFSTFLTALALVGTLFVDSCEDEATIANLKFHWHTNVGSAAAAYAVDFQTADGRKFNLSDFRYYISNIVLIKDDGTELPLTDKVLLVNPSEQDYDLGSVPTGEYKGFKFMIGLDSLTNHADPTTHAATSPLSIQSPPIHWSWNSGYIFFKVEGMVDSTAAGGQNPNKEFFYHIGLDALKRNIDFSTSAFSVSADETTMENEIALELDLLEVLDGVNMLTEYETHTFNNMGLATKIADNWQDAFSIE